MSDIKKGYTFTDKSTDWVSNKETAIRLNKMLDDAKLNLVAGTNITITPTANGPSIAATGGGTGTVTAVTGTLPILSSGGTAPDISINAATTLLPGSMSAADKTKLDGIEAGAQVNVATNLAYTDSTRVLTSSTGTDVTLPLVGADPGLMTAADKTKLDGIAAGAQVNVATNLAQGTRTTTSVPVTSSTGTPATLDVATTLLAGVMSSADKSKLDGIAANANNYSLPKATSTALGGVELFDDTVQTVVANAVTTTAARTYGVQLNNNDQMVVNVPWIDSTFAAQTEKTFFAGPASSPSATPTFRAIASTDLPAFGSGDVSFAVAGGAGTIAADAVTNSQLANMGATTVKVNATTSTADPTDLLVGTNTVVGRVAGNIVAAQVVTGQIADNAVTNAKAAQMATQTIKGRTTGGTGNAEDLTTTQATAMLNEALGDAGAGGTKGLVPAPAIGDAAKFLRGDMTYQTISGGGNALTSNPLSQFATTTSAQLAGVISDETGTGSLVFATSPTLTTPVLGVATGTSFNSITGLSSTTPLANGTAAVGVGTTTARADHVHPTTGLGLTASGLNQFAATTSAQLAGVISDETGTDKLVFNTSPTLVTPLLGTPTSGLLNSCTSNPNATGAVERTFQAKAGDVFNVKDFGASPSASAATNTTAIQNAINAAGQMGEVYIPSGFYEINDTLTATMSTDTSSVVVRGAGFGTTVLRQNGTNKGIFQIVESVRAATFEISNMRICSAAINTAAAIKVTNTSTSSQNNSHDNFISRDISIVPPPGSSGYFQFGFEMVGIWYSHFHNCHYIGAYVLESNPPVYAGTGWAFRTYYPPASTSVEVNRSYKVVTVGTNSDWTSIGGVNPVVVGQFFTATASGAIPGTGTASIRDTYSVVGQLVDCSGNLCNEVVHVYDHMEGLVMLGTQANGIMYGVVVDEHLVQCTMLGCYIDVYVACVKTSTSTNPWGTPAFIEQSSMTGCNFYAQDPSGRGQFAIDAVLVRSQIVGCSFVSNQTYPGGRTGINVRADSEALVISGNTFHQFTYKHVICAANCTSVIIKDNVQSSLGPAAPYELPASSSVRPTVAISPAAGACAVATKNVSQSISDGVYTTLTFEVEKYDDYGMFTTAANTRFTVPKAVRRVRLTGNVFFIGGGSGYCLAIIEKNGSLRVASCVQLANANARINLCSYPVDVVEGDYFELKVQQNSGTALDISVDETFFSMEIIG